MVTLPGEQACLFSYSQVTPNGETTPAVDAATALREGANLFLGMTQGEQLRASAAADVARFTSLAQEAQSRVVAMEELIASNRQLLVQTVAPVLSADLLQDMLAYCRPSS